MNFFVKTFRPLIIYRFERNNSNETEANLFLVSTQHRMDERETVKSKNAERVCVWLSTWSIIQTRRLLNVWRRTLTQRIFFWPFPRVELWMTTSDFLFIFLQPFDSGKLHALNMYVCRLPCSAFSCPSGVGNGLPDVKTLLLNRYSEYVQHIFACKKSNRNKQLFSNNKVTKT